MSMSRGAQVVVVDDEPQIRRALQVGLEERGYSVLLAGSGEQALQGMVGRSPDVMLIDLILPGMDGLELTRRIRSSSSTPIIIISSIGEEQKKVEALELGADDYVTKPFGMPELVARIKSVLRRTWGSVGAEAGFVCGELSVNFERREVRRSGVLVHLTPKEYDLLKYLIENAGKVLTQKMLLKAVWGEAYLDQAQYLRVFVGQLRKKVEPDSARPRFILTDPGVGYRFCIDN
ncbi:MAG: response regulator [Myxococcota bacterium]